MNFAPAQGPLGRAVRLCAWGRAGVNEEEKGVYYPVDKAADWPLQFAIRLGGAALQSVLGSPLAADLPPEGRAPKFWPD